MASEYFLMASSNRAACSRRQQQPHQGVPMPPRPARHTAPHATRDGTWNSLLASSFTSSSRPSDANRVRSAAANSRFNCGTTTGTIARHNTAAAGCALAAAASPCVAHAQTCASCNDTQETVDVEGRRPSRPNGTYLVQNRQQVGVARAVRQALLHQCNALLQLLRFQHRVARTATHAKPDSIGSTLVSDTRHASPVTFPRTTRHRGREKTTGEKKSKTEMPHNRTGDSPSRTSGPAGRSADHPQTPLPIG